MIQKILSSILIGACLFSVTQARAHCVGAPPLSDKQIKNTYQVFTHLLKESPAQQHQAWLKVKNKFSSVAALLAYAREQAGQNLSEQLREEREYAREWANGCPSSSYSNQCRPHGYSCSYPSDCCSSICSGKARCR